MSVVHSPSNVLLAERPKARRGTYFIQTWGCQMNEEDTEQMGLYLEDIGFERADRRSVGSRTCSATWSGSASATRRSRHPSENHPIRLAFDIGTDIILLNLPQIIRRTN